VRSRRGSATWSVPRGWPVRACRGKPGPQPPGPVPRGKRLHPVQRPQSSSRPDDREIRNVQILITGHARSHDQERYRRNQRLMSLPLFCRQMKLAGRRGFAQNLLINNSCFLLHCNTNNMGLSATGACVVTASLTSRIIEKSGEFRGPSPASRWRSAIGVEWAPRPSSSGEM